MFSKINILTFHEVFKGDFRFIVLVIKSFPVVLISMIHQEVGNLKNTFNF